MHISAHHASRYTLMMLCVFLFLSCLINENPENANGGNTSGTETLTVLSSSGEPLAGVAIGVVQNFSETDAPHLAFKGAIDTLYTGENGIVSYSKWIQDTLNLIIQHAGEAIILRNYHYEKDTLVLKKAFQVKGRVTNLSQNISRISIQGTNLIVDVRDSGDYTFSDIPPGTYQHAIQYQNQEYYSLKRSVTVNESDTSIPLVVTAFDEIVLEDFEDSNTSGNLTSLTGTSNWWVFTDWEYGGTSSIDPASLSEFPSKILDTSGVWGNYLDVSYQINTTGTSNWAIAGLNLGAGDSNIKSDNVFADLSGLDSITFWARGSQWLLLVLNTKTVITEHQNDSHFQARINLTDSWTKYTVKPVDIWPGFNSQAETLGLTWEDVSGGVSSIKFQAFVNAHLQIDEITLHGLSELVFLPALP